MLLPDPQSWMSKDSDVKYKNGHVSNVKIHLEKKSLGDGHSTCQYAQLNGFASRLSLDISLQRSSDWASCVARSIGDCRPGECAM